MPQKVKSTFVTTIHTELLSILGEPGLPLSDLLIEVANELAANPNILPIAPGVITWDADTLQWGFEITFDRDNDQGA